MYQVSVDSTIFTVWPEAALGLVYATNINNRDDTSEFATEARGIEVAVRERFPTAEAVGQHPNIQAWRKAYRAFGCDPHKYRCSSEAIVRQVLKGNTVWGINPLVDCYNYISLKYTVPVGGEDCAKIVGNVVLKRASGTEPFVRLGGSENEPPEVGEVIYADDAGVLCRRWNWREADRTKIEATTKRAVLVLEKTSGISMELLSSVLSEAKTLLESHLKAKCTILILDEENNSILHSILHVVDFKA